MYIFYYVTNSYTKIYLPILANLLDFIKYMYIGINTYTCLIMYTYVN